MKAEKLQLRLLDAMPAIIWSASATTYQFTYVSKAAETLLGYPAQRWLDEPDFWVKHIHPEDLHIPAVCHTETVGGRNHELVYRMIAADGRVVWLRDSVNVHSVDGVPVELYGVMMDITREREAESALVESRENFRRLVERSPDCIGVHVDGNFVYVNEAFVQLLGASSAQELIGRHVLAFAHPDFLDVVQERQQLVRAGEAVPYMRQRLVRIDGTFVDVETAALPMVYDHRAGIQMIVRDITDRVRDEERFRAGEDRLQTLAAGTSEAIWEWTPGTAEVWTNDAHKELFGKACESATLFDDWLSRIHPDDLAAATAVGTAAVEGRAPHWRYEYRFRNADGEYRVLLDRGYNVTGTGGMRRMIGAMLDITSLRQAEAERAAAQAKYQCIIEQSVVGVYTRAGSRITYINQTGASALGYTAGEVMGMADATLLMEREDRAGFLAGNCPPVVRARRKDGRSIHLAFYESPVQIDGEEVSIGTMLDVTEKHAAQTALVGSERRYRELVENVRDILYAVDQEGRFVSLSSSFERISGYKAADWLGRSFEDLFEPDSVAAAVDHFRRSMAGDSGIIREYKIRASSGAVLTIEVTSQPRYIDGVVAGTVGVARDVTETHLAELKLEEAKRLASLGQLGASLAHEFNNVLMGIQPFVEVIARNAPATPRIDESITHIKQAIARGKRASQEILRFANPKDSRLTSIDAQRWLPSIVSQLQASLPAGIALRTHIAQGVQAIRADREQLEQIVTNLVFNARDAIVGDGVIDIELSIPEGQSLVRVRVRNSGPAISAEIASRIFDPLFTTKRNGTGLGLSIARRLAEGFGGSLSLVAIEGADCAFDVLIPPAEPDTVESVSVQPPATVIRRVLLVEDDDAVGQGLTALLDVEGYETTWVRDFSSAVGAARGSVRPDVAIIDVNLSDGSGIDLIPILRERWHDLPVVLSTGHVELPQTDQDDRTVALLKPYEMSDLLGAISAVSV